MKRAVIAALVIVLVQTSAHAQSATPIPTPVPLALATGRTPDAAKWGAVAELNRMFRRWCDEKCANEGGVSNYQFPAQACTYPAETWLLSGGGGYGSQAQIDPSLVICKCLGALPPPAPTPRPTATPKPISSLQMLSDGDVQTIAEVVVDLLGTP